MKKKPQGRGDQFAREARIGLTILASLVLVFVILAYKRYHHQFDPPTAHVKIHNMAELSDQPATSIEKRHVTPPVLTNGHAASAASPRSNSGYSSHPHREPDPVFLKRNQVAQGSPAIRQQDATGSGLAGNRGLRSVPERSPSKFGQDLSSQRPSPSPALTSNSTSPSSGSFSGAEQTSSNPIPVVSGQTYSLRNTAPQRDTAQLRNSSPQQNGPFAGSPQSPAVAPTRLPSNREVNSQFNGGSYSNARALPQTEPQDVVNQNRLETIGVDESFWTLSQRVYGSGQYFRALHAHVQQSQPSLVSLPAHRRIAIPSLEDLRRDFGALFPEANAQTKTSSGDRPYRIEGSWVIIDRPINLFDLARDIYGQASRFSDLVEANQDRLSPNIGAMDVLPSGTRLRLAR